MPVELLVLHSVDGRPVIINPAQITQMVQPHEEHHQVVVGVRCLVTFADGKFASVVETCDAIWAAISNLRKEN